MYDRFKFYVLSIPDCGAYIAFPCLYALPRSPRAWPFHHFSSPMPRTAWLFKHFLPSAPCPVLRRVAFSPFPASLSHLHPLPMHTQKQSIA